jgi:protein-tyrosine phosphatase
MSVIDFHSHVLPGIDDGSRNTETSIDMLSLCKKNGVDIVVATPHFYADSNRVERFVENRKIAYDKIMGDCADIPQVIMGAEIAYFEGISKAEKIDALTIGDTDIMLLEMPFVIWSDSVMQEVRDLIEKRHFHIIIAHIERFLRIPGNKPYVKELIQMPVTVQVNAETLLDFRQRSRMFKLFKEGKAHILGSDCHGMHHRRPNLWEGREALSGKFGTEILERIDIYGSDLLQEHHR